MAAAARWASEEIITLLDAYSEKRVQDYIEGMASNKNVNEEIQKIMKEESGIERTTQQIENKIKKLRSGYGKLKARMQSPGAERPYLTSALTSLEKVAFQHWDRLDQILAIDGASCEEPDPSEENQTTTKQRKASKTPLRKKPRLADALQQSNEQMEQLRETISQNVITPEIRSAERREDRERILS
ncbi:hypothetical protein AWC38_SpisGene20343 [Stylophora pistillata]|uniref:Myb/SANT-like DNA-binding domain-containing protein n=1 Tax=Stylophora pistillata TaxID=50429 RepID=A0A2B4RGQ5_STYPI|nr:hypothetical protein AWC38_SpisGene20343 [Stylophora pistillata]